MLTALVLVCSLSATPDLAQCTRDTAVDVVEVPGKFGNPAFCFMNGQAYLAQTAVGRNLLPTETIKVVCAPEEKEAKVTQGAALR